MDTSWDSLLLNTLLHARRRPPGPLLQGAMRLLLEIEHRWDRWTGRLGTRPAAPCAAVAECSEELMRVHYDLPLPLFSRMLGPSMKYSMALWDAGAADLESAQERMLADACRKAGVCDGDHVLDLGCGFGSLAAHILAVFPRARVTGLTLSRTQAAYLRAMRAQAGHPLATDRFTFLQGDFNDIEFGERFDRVLSLGVFEHVSNIGGALARLRSAVRAGGTLFLHYIVYRPSAGNAAPPRQNTFIQRHVFPGGRVYAFGEIERHQQDFSLAQSWYWPGRQYARTLRCWLDNFLCHRASIAREAALDESVLRVWEIYLRACAANFAVAGGSVFGNGQYRLVPRT